MGGLAQTNVDEMGSGRLDFDVNDARLAFHHGAMGAQKLPLIFSPQWSENKTEN